MINFYKKIKPEKEHNPGYAKTLINLPSRIAIIGPSGSMKSNALLNYLYLTTGSFSTITIVIKNDNEPLYNYIKTRNSDIVFTDTIPPLEDYDKDQGPHLIVFDDIIANREMFPEISKYFIMGRKRGITSILLSQNMYSIPKLIRNQLNIIMIKRLSSIKDLKLILSEYGLSDDINTLLEKYKIATQIDTDFLKIDINNNKIYKNFTDLL